MKKLLACVLFLASSASAQTGAEVLAAANQGVCDSAGLPTGCTDAQVLAVYCADKPAPCVDNRPADGKIYSTVNAYANAVLLPPKQREVFAARRNRVIERLVQIVTGDPVKCAAVMIAANLPTEVCK